VGKESRFYTPPEWTKLYRFLTLVHQNAYSYRVPWISEQRSEQVAVSWVRSVVISAVAQNKGTRPSAGWPSLENRGEAIAAMDFFTVLTITFGVRWTGEFEFEFAEPHAQFRPIGL
jgi:hypothetical protein